MGGLAMGIDTSTITDPREARLAMRRGEWDTMTVYRVPGYVQCNLVVLPRADAYDFLVFCNRNPEACPIIDITEPGDPEPKYAAPGADLRTDLARYAVYRDGQKTDEPTEITDLWNADSVGFLIGSSLTFDAAMRRAGIELPEQVWVLRTAIATRPAGRFHGSLVVTMRLFKPEDAIKATQLTARFHRNHGAPIHLGHPALIGADLEHPVGSTPVGELPSDKVPVFWACGVTPQQVAIESKLPLMITHASGYGFITDIPADHICQP